MEPTREQALWIYRVMHLIRLAIIETPESS